MHRIVMTASSISVSELKSNRKYFSVSMRMFSTRANLNKCAVTEAFIDDIIANKNDYVCMPLCADVSKLKKKDYRGLTHMYDKSTGTFLAEEVGSFYDYEKVSDEFGVSLIGYARINKRSKLVCEAIQELYDNNALNFSFEISAGAVDVIDGISVVDVNDANELTAMAIVSVPAYPESKALDLVAEANDCERFYGNANMQISEVDIETVKMRFHRMMHEVLGEKIYSLNTLLFCHDCVILYDYESGLTYKAEYMMDNDDFILKDFYAIDFVRSEGSEKEMIDEMNNSAAEVAVEVAEVEEKVEVEIAEEVVEAEAQTEEAEEIVAETAEEVEVVAEEKKDEEDPEEIPEEDEEENEAAELRKRCAELEAQIEELAKYKAEIEKIEEEKKAAEIKAEKDELRGYAVKAGLNVEDAVIAELVEKLDYKAIVAEANSIPVKAEEKKETSYMASFVDIRPNGIGYLLESR